MHFSKPKNKDFEADVLKRLNAAKIGVVVPCYNEERNIHIVAATMPDYVNKIVIVDDKSTDNTVQIVKDLAANNKKIELVELSVNSGVGGAIAAGYEWCRDNDIDAAAVMAGDAQMDPADLHLLLLPVIDKQANYTKGNRLLYKDSFKTVPKVRFFGNAILSLLTKFSSGYWKISDTQCGYTVADKQVLQNIDWQKMYGRYGQPNDLLIMLNIQSFVVKDVLVKPVYNVGEKSGIKISRVIFTISNVLLKGAAKRLFWKYVVYDFHPLILFLSFGLLMLLLGMVFLIHVMFNLIFNDATPLLSLICSLFSLGIGFNSLFFSMWMDMEENKHLN